MIMNNYILLIRKSDLVDYIKYGHFYPLCSSIDFDGDIVSLGKDTSKALKLLEKSNDFEYCIEYYLVHVCTSSKLSAAKPLMISDLKGIYSLNSEAHRIGLSLKPAVRLNPPIWDDSVFDTFLLNIEKADSDRGIENVEMIFGVSFSKMPKGFLKRSKKEKEHYAIIEDSFYNVELCGQESIWAYLCRYERHQNYPSDNRGFFLDAIHVVYNYQKEKVLDTSMTEVPIGKHLLEMPKNISYKNLLAVMEEHTNFIKYTDKLFKGFYRIAPLYMTLKSVFKDGIDSDKSYFGMSLDKLIESLKTQYNQDDLKVALYLISFQLGWKGTYQSIYRKEKEPFLI